MEYDFHSRIEVRQADVFVAGGGPAGMAAAVTAARAGAKVFLAEAHSCLGGLGTAGMVPAFMKFDDGVNFCAGGFGRELLDRLGRAGGIGADIEVTAVNGEVLKRVYDEMAVEAQVEVEFCCRVSAAQRTGQRLEMAICAGKGGLFGVEAPVFVDCTGDGDLAAFAGADYAKGDELGRLMPGTLCSLWCNIDWSRVERFVDRGHAENLERAFAEGIFTYEDRHLSGIARTGQVMGQGNLGHTFGVDGTEGRSLTAALMWARRSMLEYQRYYRQYVRGFEKAELCRTGSLLGVRESRRILGDYELTLEDFKRRAIFEDEIGRYCYEVDIHPASDSKEDFERFRRQFSEYRYGAGENYGIPYRILTPVGLGNVLTAGRCVSTDRYMQSSVRVQPGCFITGQAAGMAAAMCAEQGRATRDIDVGVLQRRLKEAGGFLPNC